MRDPLDQSTLDAFDTADPKPNARKVGRPQTSDPQRRAEQNRERQRNHRRRIVARAIQQKWITNALFDVQAGRSNHSLDTLRAFMSFLDGEGENKPCSITLNDQMFVSSSFEELRELISAGETANDLSY